VKVTRKLAIISGEELFKTTFDLKTFYEEMVLGDLKILGHKFIKWEWIREVLSTPHLALLVTYEERKKMGELDGE